MQPPEATLKIIDSKGFKRIRPFLIALFLITYALSIIFTIPVFIAVLIIGLNIWSIGYMKWKTKNWESHGQIFFQSESIVIQKGNEEPLSFPISQLTEFKITRGAEIHKVDLSFFPDTHDNWISFEYNQEKVFLEFCIKNKKENEVFEKWIGEYRVRYPAFYYTSI